MLEPDDPDPAVEPDVAEPLVPDPVVPAVEPLVLPDDFIAFARMKLPARVLDEVDPAVAVEPLVPAVLLPLGSCRQPVTVIVLALPLPVALCVGLCGAAPTIQPAPIASANAVHVCLFMRNFPPRRHVAISTPFLSVRHRGFRWQDAERRREHWNQPR